ncbi:MAG: rod shape-determining protein MreD [bacterium]|nr:rod shape-determining protein MreD [bacterium]
MNRFLIILAGLVLLIVQSTLLSRFNLFGIKPDLVVLFVVGRSLAEGPSAGVVWGFAFGLLLDAMSSGLLGLGALTYSLAGFLAGQIAPSRGQSRLSYLMALALAALLSFGIFMYFSEPIEDIGWLTPLLLRALPSAILTWILGLIWAFTPFSVFNIDD